MCFAVNARDLSACVDQDSAVVYGMFASPSFVGRQYAIRFQFLAQSREGIGRSSIFRGSK